MSEPVRPAVTDPVPERAFSSADQEEFAALSGDWNPIHVDAVAARRTQAGRPVVHGLHTLLWALDSLAASDPGAPVPGALRADFTSFLPVDRPATLEMAPRSGASRRVTVWSNGSAVLRAELRDGARPAAAPSGAGLAGRQAEAPGEPLDLGLADIEGRAGVLAYATGPEAVATAFPALARWLGPAAVQALIGCTRLVGMSCPGLHSIFNRIDASFGETTVGEADGLRWAVTALDPRFRRVTLSVAGGGLSGTLFASVRAAPVAQPALAAVAHRVAPGRFAGAKALVIGGSRGLGELTAKLLAAGGAEVVVTYARGRADAERVAGEIAAWGGTCRALPYDAGEPPAPQLAAERAGLTHAYYYATTLIQAPTRTLFDPARFGELCRLHVDGFAALCDALGGGAEVRAFYPSTVFLDEPPPDLVEYVMAKAAGEALCEAINRRRRGVAVVSARLPALATDQNAALEAPGAIEALLPVIGRVQGA